MVQGGWWIKVEVHVGYGPHELCCHVPKRLTGWPVRIRPDRGCEIASPNHEKRDFVDKLGMLHRAEVPHYWILHPEEGMLLVHRWRPEGYVTILSATSGQRERAERFEAIEIDVGELSGEE